MKLIFTAITLLLIVTSAMGAQTMRVDYYHTGDASQEVFSVDRVVIEPLPWSGDPAPRSKDKAALVFAWLCFHLRGVGNDRRSEDDQANVSGVTALPCTGSAGHCRVEEA
jgi:hypothetical protein